MSLKHLSTGKSAQFFRPNPRRRISKTAATELVKKISSPRSGRIQEKKIRESLTIDGSIIHITYVCFPVDSEPTFLAGSGLKETRYAYFLLIEAPETIAVFKRSVEGMMQALSRFILPWKYEELGGVYAANNPAFEKISLRAMSVAANVVKRRSLEADNLAESMAVVGVHRSIPYSFRARGTEGTHTISPGSARISRRDTRTQLEELVRWVMRTGTELKGGAGNYPKTFLAEFCTAVPLSEIPTGTRPNAILFDFSELRANWEDAPGDYEFKLMHSTRSNTGHILSEKEILALLAMAEQVLTIDGGDISYTSPRDKAHVVGHIRMNKNSISVRSGLLDQITIRNLGVSKRLSTYANEEGNFLITFSEPEYGYAHRQLFRDMSLLGSIDGMLRIFEPQAALSKVTAEKAPSKTEFKKNGIFRFVEDSNVPAGAHLVCDDFGDEWADYIAVDTTSTPPHLQFLHCKHGKKSSSASGLQEPIGQAIKNLSRMFRGSEFFATKVNGKWSQKYSTTQIPRIRRGASANDLNKAFKAVLSDPNTERSVVLVLSSISLKQLTDAFNALKAGTAKPHVSQLLWLLSEFIAACREHGVRPHVICQP
jgi:hypothetical protein